MFSLVDQRTYRLDTEVTDLRDLLSFLLFLSDEDSENDPRLRELALEIDQKSDLVNKLVSINRYYIITCSDITNRFVKR